MKKISIVSPIIAFIILHTVIPHKHHEEMTINEHITLHKNANNLFDYLSLAFHTDLLKNLESGTQFNNRVFELIKLTSTVSGTNKPEDGIVLKFNLLKFNKHPESYNYIFVKRSRKRAPPHLQLS